MSDSVTHDYSSIMEINLELCIKQYLLYIYVHMMRMYDVIFRSPGAIRPNQYHAFAY